MPSIATLSDVPGIETDDEKLHQDIAARIAALQPEYEACTKQYLGRARQALEAARALPGDRQPEIEKISRIAHNFRGQGSSFGYDLITLVCDSLYTFIRHLPDATDDDLKVIDLRLGAVAMVLEKRIRGSGGQFADTLRNKLEHMIAASRA